MRGRPGFGSLCGGFGAVSGPAMVTFQDLALFSGPNRGSDRHPFPFYSSRMVPPWVSGIGSLRIGSFRIGFSSASTAERILYSARASSCSITRSSSGMSRNAAATARRNGRTPAGLRTAAEKETVTAPGNGVAPRGEWKPRRFARSAGAKPRFPSAPPRDGLSSAGNASRPAKRPALRRAESDSPFGVFVIASLIEPVMSLPIGLPSRCPVPLLSRTWPNRTGPRKRRQGFGCPPPGPSRHPLS